MIQSAPGNEVEFTNESDIPNDFAGSIRLDIDPESDEVAQKLIRLLRDRKLVFARLSLRGAHVSDEVISALEGQTIRSLVLRNAPAVEQKDIECLGKINALESLTFHGTPLGPQFCGLTVFYQPERQFEF